MAETIILDPPAVAAGRTQLDITTYIAGAGVNWGDAAIQAYLADMEVGSSPVDYRIPNRQITMPLSLRTVPGQTFDQIRTSLQQKLGLWQRENGWLMRTLDGAPVYADVTNATLHLGGSWLQAFHDVDVDAVLTLDARPDWYGDEITLADHVETVASRLVFTEPWIAGNYPGRVRVVVDNDSAADFHGMLWGLRSRYYDSAVTAALSYEAEALTMVNGTISASTTLAASGGRVAQNMTIPASAWATILVTTLASGSQPLTHRGSYRVWARCATAAAVAPQVRLQWGVGSFAVTRINDAVVIPGLQQLYTMDLGVIRVDAPPVGAHQWFGAIQAMVATANDIVIVDHLYLQPLDDGAGKLTCAPNPAPAGVIATPDTTAGTIANDASSGTVDWDVATLGVFQVPPSGASHYLKMTGWGITIPAGVTITGIQASVSYHGQSLLCTVHVVKGGAVVGAAKNLMGLGGVGGLVGGPSDLWGESWLSTDIDSGFGIAIQVFRTERSSGSFWLSSVPVLTVYYQLTTGFTVADDAVIYAGQSAELRTEGMYREAGLVFGAISTVVGDLPRVPPSGLEGRAVEVFLKSSSGDFASESDATIDDISARVIYRPSYLYTP